MNNELYALVNELNFKKDVLDTKTTTIVDGIKDWCINENNRINGEFEELKKFVNENFRLFTKNMTRKSWGNGSFRYSWSGLEISGNDVITDIGLDTEWEYGHNLGIWSNLPKPMKYRYYDFYDKLDMNNTDVTYWTDYKRYLAIRNEYLCEVTKKIKSYLGNLILEQDKRFEDMNKACKEIDEDNTETIEIKVKVRI